MYKIGEFSLLNKVTIKTLRYYDEIGLFKPKLVDKFTGYRYYDESQQEEFDKIVKYKNLGFSLEDIIKLKDNVDEEIIKEKLEELKNINKDNDKKIEILSSMIGGDNMINIEFKKYNENYKLGKRLTLKSRNDFEKELSIIAQEIDKLNINKGKSILCNFEMGYEEDNIDVFVGYEVALDDVPERIQNKYFFEKGELELMSISKCEKYLIGTSNIKDIDNLYSKMIEYAHNNKIQIRSWFTEIYNGDKVEIYTEAFDLEEVNTDYLYMLGKFNAKEEYNERDERLVGTYRIKDILYDAKYMLNENKQKSSLDTKYKELELRKDGTTNFENITWNNKNLMIKYDGIIIPMHIYIIRRSDNYYLQILMNETLEFYKSQRPMSYIYEKIVK